MRINDKDYKLINKWTNRHELYFKKELVNLYDEEAKLDEITLPYLIASFCMSPDGKYRSQDRQELENYLLDSDFGEGLNEIIEETNTFFLSKEILSKTTFKVYLSLAKERMDSIKKKFEELEEEIEFQEETQRMQEELEMKSSERLEKLS